MTLQFEETQLYSTYVGTVHPRTEMLGAHTAVPSQRAQPNSVSFLKVNQPLLRAFPHNKLHSKCLPSSLSDWLVVGVCDLTISRVISRRVPTCDSVLSWRCYSAATLGDQVSDTITLYRTQSPYPYTEQTSLCPILKVPSAWLGSDKY